MNKPDKVRVFNAFSPFLRLLNAYNKDNFHQERFTPRSVCDAAGATMLIILIPTLIVLVVWFLIEVNANFKKFIVQLPLILSVLQMELTFLALMMKSRNITNTINRLQLIIDQRECVFLIADGS